MKIRQAIPDELEQIYMMGYDVWSDNNSLEFYLNECKSSPKYSKGTWYVLSDGHKLLSSLILYNFGNHIFAIGSVSTPTNLRKQGHASFLIEEMIKEISKNNLDFSIFLYSDIDDKFYEKFNFRKLPEELQRYKGTVCMIYQKNTTSPLLVPDYF